VSNYVATALLPGWLRNMKGDYMALLLALDVENSTETPMLALKTLFKNCPLTEVVDSLVPHQKDKMIPLEKLTSENALYWRCLVHYLHAEGAEMEEELDKIIPNLTPFCQYIRRYYLAGSPTDDADSWSQIQRQFIVLQLLELTKVFDLADEVGRSHLKKLIYDMLTCVYVKEGLIKILVQILQNVDPDVNSRLQFLAEVVSEVHEPMTEVSVECSAEEMRKKQLLQAKVRVQLNEIREEQAEAVHQQDFMRAQVLLEKIKELQEELQRLDAQPDVVHEQVREQQNDRATLSKCLYIIYEMMHSKTVTVLTPHLRSLMENFVLHYIEDCDTYIRSLALQALGVCCLLSQDVAKKYILVFYFQLANSEADEVCTMAVKVIFDLFLLYGLQAFQLEENGEDEEHGEKEVDRTARKKLFDATELDDADKDDSTKSNNEVTSAGNGSNSDFIKMLTSLLDSMSADIRTAAAKGLCKLLVNDRIKSPNLVSHLLIMWYNPVTEGDVYLRQMLGAFFTTLAYDSKYGQEMLEQAFLPTLRTLFQAPVTSPLIEVDQDSVVRLMLHLTRPGNKKNTVHNNLAIVLCNEVLLDSDPYSKQVLLRALTQLELVLDDEIVLQNINTLTEKVAESIQDRSCLRLIRKFQHMLSSGRRSMPVSDTATNTETATGLSVITDVEQQTIDSAEASPGSPEHIESEWSDSDDNVKLSAAHSTSKMMVPETPDHSDSPVSEEYN
jgi:condensin complex subunit 3